MNKTVIAPVVGAVVVAANLIFHIDIDESHKQELIDWVTNGVSLAMFFYGIYEKWNSHKNKKGE